MGWSKYEDVNLYVYDSANDMMLHHPNTFHSLTDRIDGTGFVVYDGCLYYNKVGGNYGRWYRDSSLAHFS